MKALNRTRQVEIKYPRGTPRISRKRLWMDRSEWREDPQTTYDGSTAIIDQAMHEARNTGSLQGSKLEGLTNYMNRAGRVGVRKV